MRSIQNGVLGVRKDPLAARAEKPGSHRAHLFASTERLEQHQLRLQLFEPLQV